MYASRLADTERLQAALGDRYVVEREVARGGWASVYRARDRKHERIVAVKVFHPELAHTLGPERFLQEIRLVAGMQHPYVVPLHDSGETAESLYYVMPFVEGETLRDRLMRERRVPLDDALAIARDVLAALAYAHDHGVLHRDVKPENIMLSGGHALVMDFGISRAISKARGDRLSRPGIAVGTPAYMAPEQSLGGEDADGRSDVYSLSAVLYEMLTGRPPYPDATLASVVDRHVDDPRPDDLGVLRPDVPPEVAAAVMKALALMPDDRFPTAGAFADALATRVTPVAPTLTPTETARRDLQRGKRRVMFALAAVAVTIALAFGIVESRRGPPDGPARIAVFPFAVRGDAEYAYLGAGMVDLLSANLDGAGELRAVDAHAVLGVAGSAGADSTPLSPERARALAQRLGATRFVIGSVTENGGQLRLLATLYDRGEPPRALVQAAAAGADGQLFDLVDKLTADLIAGERRGPGGRLTRLAAVTTQSLPALKAYLRGEEELRDGHADSAMVLFGVALQLDPRFGLAAYRRAVAADWVANFSEARVAGEQALRLGDRLAENDRELLEAFLAWHRGDAARAERLYRAILAERPDDVEAWYQLGEVLFHYGAVRGQPIRLAQEPFERAHALDPKTGHAVLHLLDIAARAGDDARFDSLLSTLRIEGAILLRRRAARDLAVGTPDQRAATLEALAGATDGTIAVTVGHLVNFRHDLTNAAEAARLLLAPSRQASTQAYGHVLLAQIAWARGRPLEASRHLDQAAAIDSALALEWRAFGAAMRWIPAQMRDLEQLAARLDRWDGAAPARAEQPSTPVVTVHDSVHAALRLYLAAQIGARMGNLEGARALAARLDSLPLPATEGSLAADLAHGVRARLAADRGDEAGALAALDAMPRRSPLERIANSPFFAISLERWLRAELLREAGRLREATGWYESLGEWRPDIALTIVALLRSAQLREAAGDRAAAIEAYRTVLREWRDCEPEMRQLRDEAAAGLQRLGAR